MAVIATIMTCHTGLALRMMQTAGHWRLHLQRTFCFVSQKSGSHAVFMTTAGEKIAAPGSQSAITSHVPIKAIVLYWKTFSVPNAQAAQHSTAQQAWNSTAISTAQHSTAQHSTAQHSTAQHSTAQHSTAQHSTAQHSTAQHSTAQHSTAQHSTAISSMFLA